MCLLFTWEQLIGFCFGFTPPPTFYITFLCFPVSACAVGGKNVGGRLQVMTLGLLIESEEFRSVLVPTEVLGA